MMGAESAVLSPLSLLAAGDVRTHRNTSELGHCTVSSSGFGLQITPQEQANQPPLPSPCMKGNICELQIHTN